MFNAHANSNEIPEISNKQYLIIGPNNEFLLSTHSPDPDRLIVHPASGRSLFLSGESLATAFETKKIMTLYTFNNSVLVQAVDIGNLIFLPTQFLMKINPKLHSVQDLEAAYEQDSIISISIKKFNKINELIKKRQFKQVKEELKLTLKKPVKLDLLSIIAEETHESNISAPTNNRYLHHAAVEQQLSDAPQYIASNSNERINVPYSNNKKRPRSVADDGEKDSGLAKNYYGKQYLGGVLPLGELIFLNDGPSKRLIVHPASNRASSLTGEALKKAFIEQKVITRGQYYVKLLIDLNSLTKVDCKLFTPEELEERFAKEEIVSVTSAQFNQVLGYHINNSESVRNFLKAACNRPSFLVNQSYLTNNRSSVEGTLAAHESNISTSTNSLNGGKGENTTIANSSNIDHREEMLWDSNSDALVGGLDSEAVVSQSATCYSNDNDLEKTLELINDEDLEKILELIDKDMAPLFVEQNSHINDCSLQQLREANYRHSSPCFFKSSVDTERNNPETRLNSPNSGKSV